MLIEANLACRMLVQDKHGGGHDTVVKTEHNPDLRRDGDSVTWTGPDGRRRTARWLGLTETNDPAPTPTEDPEPRADEPAGSTKGPGRAGKAGRRSQAR